MGRAILAVVRAKPRLVVAKSHSVVGGLGEAVASALLQNGVQPARFRLAGLSDAYLDAGAMPALHSRYGISTEALSCCVKTWLGWVRRAGRSPFFGDGRFAGLVLRGRCVSPSRMHRPVPGGHLVWLVLVL